MKISGSNINTSGLDVHFFRRNIDAQPESAVKNKSAAELPSSHSLGRSQVISRLPVSYQLMGEISIPGLKEKAKIYKLANGQRIITAPKPGPVVIKTTYSAGSLNEPDKIRGMSHFIEHNLFNGSRFLKPKEYDEKVSSLGGETNASTGFAAVDYYLKVQMLDDSYLEKAIMLNSEQTQYPSFPEYQIEKEKEPVKSEIDMCAGNPEISAACIALKNLFKIKSASKNFVTGTKENINSFTRGDAVDFYNIWHVPDNAVTVITGGFDSEKALKLVSRYYTKKNTGAYINEKYYEPLEYNSSPVRKDIIQQNTEQPSITMAFAAPEGTPPEDIDKIDVLSAYIKSPQSSLYKALDKLGASIDIETENMQNKPKGAKALILNVYASEDKLEDAVKTMYSEINRIIQAPPPADEIDNAKNSVISALLSTAESSSALNAVLTSAAIEENYDYYNSKLRNTKAVKPEDISKTAAKFLDLNKISMCVSHHKDAQIQEIFDRHKKSNPKPAKVSFGAGILPVQAVKEDAAKIKSAVLRNNACSTIQTGNPYAKSAVCINLRTDELNKASYPEFMLLNEMLNRGSLKKGADDFNKILGAKDISMNFSAGTDGISAAVQCRSSNIPDMIKLVKEKIAAPNFTEEEFKRAVIIVKDTLSAEKISAFDKLYQEMYKGLNIFKSKETKLKELENITLDDIKRLYSKIMKTSQAHFHMTISADAPEKYKDLFNSEFSSGLGIFRPHTNKRGADYSIYQDNTEEKIFSAEREQPQAEIVQGYKYKVSKNADDIAKINILNIILGAGGMSSRLFLDLREDKKLAYAAGTRLSSEKDTGVLALRIETTTESSDEKEGSPDNALKALEGFNRNIERLKHENVSVKELHDAKAKFKTALLNNLETNLSKSISYASAAGSDYGIKYSEKLIEAIDKVTADDVRAAACYVFKNPPVISIAAGRKTLHALKLS